MFFRTPIPYRAPASYRLLGAPGRSYPFPGQPLALHARSDWEITDGDGTNPVWNDKIISLHVLQPSGVTQQFILGFYNDGTPPPAADVALNVVGFAAPVDFKNAIRGVLINVQVNLPTPLIVPPDVATDGLFTVFQPFPGLLGNTVISPSNTLDQVMEISGLGDFDADNPLFYDGAELVPLRFGKNFGVVPSAQTPQTEPAPG